jgi:hypothetical protein
MAALSSSAWCFWRVDGCQPVSNLNSILPDHCAKTSNARKADQIYTFHIYFFYGFFDISSRHGGGMGNSVCLEHYCQQSIVLLPMTTSTAMCQLVPPLSSCGNMSNVRERVPRIVGTLYHSFVSAGVSCEAPELSRNTNDSILPPDPCG